MSHPNAELLRQAYGMRNEGQVASVRDMFDEDIVWHTLSGDLHGPDEVLSMLGESDRMAGGTTSREVHALFADERHGVVVTTVRAERPGRRYEDRQVHVYRFRDGRVIEFWEYLGDRRAHEEFWTREGLVPTDDPASGGAQ